MSTFVKAISNGNFITWPGITDISFYKHLPKSIPTYKGHLDQERQHLQSTSTFTDSSADTDAFPTTMDPNTKTLDALASITTFTPKHTACGNLTGGFPHKSSRGNQHFLIIYDYDSNAILVELLPSKTAGDIQKPGS